MSRMRPEALLLLVLLGVSCIPSPTYGFLPHQQQLERTTGRMHTSITRASIGNAQRVRQTSSILSAPYESNSEDGNEKEKKKNSQQPTSGLIDEMLSPSNEAYSRYTHLIAIPLEQNHDLMVELESVQRAVLYHCPLLINACIVPEMTRMPMLYVDASSSKGSSSSDGAADARSAKDILGGKDIFSVMRSGGNNGGGSENSRKSEFSSDNNLGRDPITAELHSIVSDVVKEQIYANSNKPAEEEDDDVQPILMSFHGLEMDGPANEALHTIGTETSPGTTKLRSILDEVRTRIEAKGWSTALPADKPQGGVPDDTVQGQWRPRVPFMRLPANFEDSLPPPKGTDGNYDNYTDEQKANYVRQAEEGGNGISPIFWYRWWDDDFPAETVGEKGIRLREVGVYERTAPFGCTEHAFYLPHMKVDLPGGDAALAKKEKEDEKDSMKRMQEKEEQFAGEGKFDMMDAIGEDLVLSEREGKEQLDAGGTGETDRRMMEALSEGGILWEGNRIDANFDKGGALDEDGSTFDNDSLDVPRFDSMEDEMRVSRTDAERRMLQDVYDASPSEDTGVVDFVDVESERADATTAPASPAMPTEEDYAVVAAKAMAAKRKADGTSDATDQAANTSEGDQVKKKEIVDKIRKPIATGDWSSSKPKDKVPWQDNPVFKDWKSRVTMAENDEAASKSKPLPPFPAREHFVGPWRMVSSPTATFDGAALFGNDASMSENIILRVDGTIAGGPILDMEQMHRAAGGTWKSFQAERIIKDGNDMQADGAADEQTRLRIRLVVPPKKERILVMEGQALQVTQNTAESGKIDASSMVSPGTFGIPLAEAAIKAADEATSAKDQSSSSSETGEDILRCSGEVWVEDARTGANRKKLGRFVIEKLRVSDPKKLVYTVPKPTRIQD